MFHDRARRHPPHEEVPGGISHITWRLHRAQAGLTADERTVVLETLRRDHGTRCVIHASVIMDDHVHVLLGGLPGGTTAQLARSWMSTSSRRVICRSTRSAPLWQAEYYQRWIASPRLVPICAEYIPANPSRKWPGITGYPWVLPPA